MTLTPQSEFLRFSAKTLREQFERIETCLAKLTPEQVWQRGGESQNAIGNLILHLTGNLREWILQGLDGVDVQRDRDAEFATRDGAAPDVLLRDLKDTLEAALKVIEEMPPERLTWIVCIMKSHVSMLEAVYHVVEHFSGHTGQIVLLTKAYTGSALGFYSYRKKP